MKKRIGQFYEQFSNDNRILIPINADPDAIASAMAVKRLMWRRSAAVVIATINRIKRPDNLKMVRLLGVNLVPLTSVDPSQFNKIVYVDSQPDHNEAFAPLKPDIVIDHHPDTAVEVPFRDIRPEYGATSSIMTEYIKAARIIPSMRLATALHYGIKTDTGSFSRKAVLEDIRAFQYLHPFANINLSRQCEQAEMNISFLKTFKKAIDNKSRRKNRIFVNLGSVSNPDVCVLIAEFFLRIDNIHWSIVSGLYGNKLIIIFRSDGYRRHSGNVAKKCFGAFGSAGGHKSMARAEISLSNIKDLVDCQNERKLQNWIIRQLRR